MYIYNICVSCKNACSTCACVSRLPVTGSSVRIFQMGTCVLLLYPYHNIIWVAAELYIRSPFAVCSARHAPIRRYCYIIVIIIFISCALHPHRPATASRSNALARFTFQIDVCIYISLYHFTVSLLCTLNSETVARVSVFRICTIIIGEIRGGVLG